MDNQSSKHIRGSKKETTSGTGSRRSSEAYERFDDENSSIGMDMSDTSTETLGGSTRMDTGENMDTATSEYSSSGRMSRRTDTDSGRRGSDREWMQNASTTARDLVSNVREKARGAFSNVRNRVDMRGTYDNWFGEGRALQYVSRHSGSLILAGAGLAWFIYEMSSNRSARVDETNLETGSEMGTGRMEGVKQSISGAKDTVVDAANRTVRRSQELYEESPASIALGSLAAGAILGMIIPSSEMESRVMGRSGGAIYGAARSAIRDNSRRMMDRLGNIANVASTVMNRGGQNRENRPQT